VGDAVKNHHFGEIEGAYALYAGNINAELAWVRASLMVRIDTADLAEIMFRRSGVELVKRQVFLASDEFNVRKLCRNGNSAPYSAIGARTPSDRVELIRQADMEPR